MLVIEWFTILLYTITIICARKLSLTRFAIYATIFACLFENLNVNLFKDVEGGYSYSTDFTLFVFHTPLFVILSWGIILVGSYVFAQGLGLGRAQRVFFVPLSALVIDFVLEGMSVMQHYWTWHGFSYGGVLGSIAPGNFVGWMGVTFGFVIAYDYLPWKWPSLFLGYLGFLFIGALAKTMNVFFSWEGMQGYYSFSILFTLFLIGHFHTLRMQHNVVFQRWHYLLIGTRAPFFVVGFVLHYQAGLFLDWALVGLVTFALLFDLGHLCLLVKRQPLLQQFVVANKEIIPQILVSKVSEKRAVQ